MMAVHQMMAGRVQRPTGSRGRMPIYSVRVGRSIEIIMQLDDDGVCKHFQIDVTGRNRSTIEISGTRAALRYFAQALDDIQDQSASWQRSATVAAQRITNVVGADV